MSRCGTTASEDESSTSSFYSSFLKTEEGQSSCYEGRADNDYYDLKKINATNKAPKLPIKRSNPQWLDNVNLTDDLVYQYQIDARTLSDVLKADLLSLKKTNQVRKKIAIEV